MITGRKAPKPLTKDDLLSRVSALDVYQYYIPERIVVNQSMCSPIRNDRNPSFMISDRDGKIHHFDYADSDHKGNCIDFVMQLRKLSFKDALELINYDMNLQGMPVIYAQASDEEEKVKVKVRRNTSIIVKTRKWYKEALEYWEEYGIEEQELKEEKIYCIGELYLNRSRFSLPTDELAFGYLIDDKYWKILRPKADKRNKWMYNGPNDYIEGFNDAPTGGSLIITKSRKDRICLRHIFDNVVNVQNESIVAFSKRNLAYIKDNWSDVYINYDADEPGKKNSLKVTTELNFKHLNTPDELLGRGIKDFAGWIKYAGYREARLFLEEKGIL